MMLHTRRVTKDGTSYESANHRCACGGRYYDGDGRNGTCQLFRSTRALTRLQQFTKVAY